MDVKTWIAVGTLIALLWALAKYKKTIVFPLALALVISALWTYTYQYEYAGENFFVLGRINIYPLILWTAGLTGLAIIQRRWIYNQSVLLTTLVYITILFIGEAIGYHSLNIRLATHFPGLWNLDIIHGPAFLQLFYIVAGPLYLGVLRLLHK